MILTHGSSALLGAVALAFLAYGSGTDSAEARAVGVALVAATAASAIGALGVIGRSYARLIGGLRVGAALLQNAALAAQTTATQRASAASEQSGAIRETSATVEELAAVARSIAENGRAVGSAAEQTVETMESMQQTVVAIAERSQALGEGSQRIDEILEVINEFAERTNLLALNAAIEAARAGDAGKGFAVVASEVRKLAARSLDSSESIHALVQTIQREASATAMATEPATRQVREVVSLMQNTAELVDSTLAATEHEQAAAEQVAAAIAQIRDAAEQIAADRSRHLAAVGEVSFQADELVGILAKLGAGPDQRTGVAGNFVKRNVYESGTPLGLMAAAAAILGSRHGTGVPFGIGVALAAGGCALFVWIRCYRVRRLLGALDRIRSGLGRLADVAHGSEAGTAATATAIAEQSTAVAQTAAAIEELAATAASIAESSMSVAAAAEETANTARQVRETVESIAGRSRTLGSSSRRIDEILALINEISEQTNLLALNAAIEAARAGDAGKGFAVVAGEIRQLAERSLESSAAIREIVRTIQDETTATIAAAEHGTAEVHAVAELMARTSAMLEESILATRQQKSAAEQVAGAMTQIQASSDQLLADVDDGHGRAIDDAVAALQAALDGMVGNGSRRRRAAAAATAPARAAILFGRRVAASRDA